MNYFISVNFLDTLHFVIAHNNCMLLLICCIRIFLVKAAGIWMDATSFLYMYRFFQLLGFASDSVHFHYWSLSKKGTRKYQSDFQVLESINVYFQFIDPSNVPCTSNFHIVDNFICLGYHFSITHWSCRSLQFYDRFGVHMLTKCLVWNFLCTRNTIKIVWWNRQDYEQIDCFVIVYCLTRIYLSNDKIFKFRCWKL